MYGAPFVECLGFACARLLCGAECKRPGFISAVGAAFCGMRGVRGENIHRQEKVLTVDAEAY